LTIIQVKKKKLLLNRIRAYINSKKERRDVREKKKKMLKVYQNFEDNTLVLSEKS
jgi:hypothetical protein